MNPYMGLGMGMSPYMGGRRPGMRGGMGGIPSMAFGGMGMGMGMGPAMRMGKSSKQSCVAFLKLNRLCRSTI